MLNFDGLFRTISEGHYIFTIENVREEKNAEFGDNVIYLSLKANDGQTTRQRYGIGTDEQPVQGAVYALFNIACAALNTDLSGQQLDIQSLKGRRFEADVTHTTTEAGRTYANITNCKPVAGDVNISEPQVKKSLDELFGKK